jgi:hypothetical protein
MEPKSQAGAARRFLFYPIFILLCEMVVLAVGQSFVEQRQLETRGQTTDATAILTQYKAAGRAGGAYYMLYQFRYNGSWHQGEWQTTEAWVKAAKIPAPIRVVFLPDNPAISWAPDVGVHRSLALKAVCVVVSFGLAVFLAVKVLGAWLRSGQPFSVLGMGLIVASWVLTALEVLEIFPAPVLLTMLAMGCVCVAAGLSPLVWPTKGMKK